VWSAILDVGDARFGELNQMLSADELSRARRFHVVHDARRFISARGMLRELLGHLASVSPRSHTLPAIARYQAFFNCWTRKEAYLKARGLGLSIPLSSFDVSLLPGQPAALLRTSQVDDLNRWRLYELELGSGFVGAVAGFGLDWKPILHDCGQDWR
jgi:phosphopantetheinyl transferase